MKCRDCTFLFQRQVFKEGVYPEVRCTKGLWDKHDNEQWHSYGETQLNRGPVRRFGDSCKVGALRKPTSPPEDGV